MARPVLSLERCFDPRRNNLGLQRLLLAGTVVAVHGQALTSGHQPSVFNADLGELAVDGFFVLSGFLVTRSALRLDSVRRFLWHRAVRILPGYWVCLLLTATLVAPTLALLGGRSPWSVFTGHDSAVLYVLRNAALMIRQFGISDLRQDEATANALDGSLWSLFYESVCYLAVAALVLAGVLVTRPVRVGGRHSQQPFRLLVHRREVMAAAFGMLWVSLIADKLVVSLPMHLGRQMMFVFLIGVLAELYAEHIPMDLRLAVSCAALWLASCALLYEYRIIGGLAFGYLLLWVAVAAPVLPQPKVDLSYGVYMYHWPLDTILIAAGLNASGLFVFLAGSAVLTLVLAAGSWYLVEARALRYKNARWVEHPRWRFRDRGAANRPAHSGSETVLDLEALEAMKIENRRRQMVRVTAGSGR